MASSRFPSRLSFSAAPSDPTPSQSSRSRGSNGCLYLRSWFRPGSSRLAEPKWLVRVSLDQTPLTAPSAIQTAEATKNAPSMACLMTMGSRTGKMYRAWVTTTTRFPNPRMPNEITRIHAPAMRPRHMRNIARTGRKNPSTRRTTRAGSAVCSQSRQRLKALSPKLARTRTRRIAHRRFAENDVIGNASDSQRQVVLFNGQSAVGRFIGPNMVCRRFHSGSILCLRVGLLQDAVRCEILIQPSNAHDSRHRHQWKIGCRQNNCNDPRTRKQPVGLC